MITHNVLILGSGAREHALAKKISHSHLLGKLFVAPGNAGTGELCHNLDISQTDFESIANCVIQHQISIVIVGPEVPLVAGIVDFFKSSPQLGHVLIIGPDSRGAMLEGSKHFAKNFMKKYGIPCANSQSFTIDELQLGYKYLENLPPPYVLKASGLASGKGVLIVENLQEAKLQLFSMLSGMFGDASKTVVIEEFLSGIELSAFIMTDGKSYKILPTAKDYKRIGGGDTGLNTGGMGSVSPVPFITPQLQTTIEETVIKPTISGLQSEGIDYRGFIFIGIMNCSGTPKVIEYNCRLGDPETQSILGRINSDLLQHLISFNHQTLQDENLDISNTSVVTVVMASGGYPGSFSTGHNIHISKKLPMCEIFHGGTKLADSVITDGGRVLSITATADTIIGAKELAYNQIEHIHFTDKYYRGDISDDLLD